jgi:hypothetical protein
MKCTYCNKNSEYSLHAVLDSGTVEILACEEHKMFGYFNQQNAINNEQFRQRMKSHSERLERQSMYPFTSNP